jgi:DNA-binding MarR family transcriptional regulator
MEHPAGKHIPRYQLCNNDTLRKATRCMGQLFDEAIAASGLRNSQFSVLVHVDELDEPTMKELAHELVMDLSALGHSLQPLIRDGLVRLVPNPEDGRSKRVTLTKAGQRKVAEATGYWALAQRRFEDLLGQDKAQRLRETLIALSSSEFSEAFAASARIGAEHGGP